ncbi:amidase (plasmid) [Mesorhizobium sp. ORM8.1]
MVLKLEEDAAFMSASELSRRLEAGELTSQAIVEDLLTRIQASDGILNSFVSVCPDSALAAARASDNRRENAALKGPLDGVPFAAKDLFDVKGMATKAGSKAVKGQPANKTATVVGRLVAQGMVLLGKTHTTELAFSGWGTNPSVGTPVNPHDLTLHRVPGGSSSGSAVAVASGLVPVALGTDTGGSVRNPAALCGVIGLKTSVGLIGRNGTFLLAPTFDSIGPITRSVEDAAHLLAVLQGEDAGDPATYGAPIVDPLGALDEGVSGLTFCVPPRDAMLAAEPAILDQFYVAVSDLAAIGATIEERQLPRPLQDYITVADDISGAEMWHRFGAMIEAPESLVDPIVAARISRAKNIDVSRYLQCIEIRRLYQIEFHDHFQHAHALLLPGSPITARASLGAHEADAPFGIFARLANLMDFAALNLPIGRESGLPVSLQVIVRRYADPMALRIGRALESHRGGLFHPPMIQPAEKHSHASSRVDEH